MVKVCIYVILALGSHIGPGADMATPVPTGSRGTPQPYDNMYLFYGVKQSNISRPRISNELGMPARFAQFLPSSNLYHDLHNFDEHT